MSTTIEPVASEVGADRRGHRLLDEEHLAGARADGAFLDRAPLDLRGAVGHADDDARARPEPLVVVDLLDEVLEHLLGDREVRDHAVLHRADGRDVARRASEHLLGREPDRLDGLLAAGTAFLADGDHRRLVEDDALAAHVDERVGGAEVDGEVGGKVLGNEGEHLDPSGIWGNSLPRGCGGRL
jgi:hypothetical protein